MVAGRPLIGRCYHVWAFCGLVCGPNIPLGSGAGGNRPNEVAGEGARKAVMHYHAYELAHALLSPWRIGVEAMRAGLDHPLNPFAANPAVRGLSAACQVFEKVTRRYGKPSFAITEARAGGSKVSIREDILLTKPFCTLRRFSRVTPAGAQPPPQILLVAPMSGHYATLLRDTIGELCGTHDVAITDWTDARDVPLLAGDFGLADFNSYVIECLRLLGPRTHVIAVSQSSVPALAVTALLAAKNDPCTPLSLTLLGGPIDTRISPTAVNRLVETRPIGWFERHVISQVPLPHTGALRRVYPGFMQLTGFMTMDLDQHVSAHAGLFNDLVTGDEDRVRLHGEFYDDYLAVMDLTAEFFLDTVAAVFQRHALPRGTLHHNGQRVDCSAIRNTALLTIEAGRDVICGPGQTHAAQGLCPNVADDLKVSLDFADAGHFGLFTGSQWRSAIAPCVTRFIRAAEDGAVAQAFGPLPENVVRLQPGR